MKPHLVKQGEYLSRLAAERGFDAVEVWAHPDNAALRERRRSPEVLAPGDVVFLPAPAERRHRVELGGANRFKAPMPRIPIKVRLVERGEALSREPCLVEGLGPEEVALFADAEGVVSFDIPPHLEHVTLVLPARDRRVHVRVGHLDPLETPSGLAQRLENLGFLSPGWQGLPEDARETRVRSALRRFQTSRSLPSTGALDDASRRALGDAHRG
jgi:hypothetical protein